MGIRFQEEKVIMKCVICKHGETQEGTATVTLERVNVTVVFKDVPAQVCTNCGEEYIDAQVTQQLLSRQGIYQVLRRHSYLGGDLVGLSFHHFDG